MTETQKKAGIAAAVLAAIGVAYGTYHTALRGGSDCPPWTCGANSAEVVGYPLHLDGESNEDGYRLTGFETRDDQGKTTRYALDGDAEHFVAKDHRRVRLDVVDSRFVVVSRDETPITGEHVNILLVGNERAKGEKHHELPVTNVAAVQSWANVPGQEPRQITAYLFDNRLPGSSSSKLCQKGARWANPGESPKIAQMAPLRWDQPSHYALLLAGERYDAKTARVIPGQRWVTIACAGSALAKMKLMGYDPEIAHGDALHTTADQRQATLKMITAMYCEREDNKPKFTRDGTPLAWQNGAGRFDPPWELVRDVEARWDDNGATCLGTPREIPREKVVKACGEIPRCPPLDSPVDQSGPTYPIEGNEWMTFNRKEPSLTRSSSQADQRDSQLARSP